MKFERHMVKWLHTNLNEKGKPAITTTTFGKRIIIDDSAADVMIALLDKPALPCPDISGRFREPTRGGRQMLFEKSLGAVIGKEAEEPRWNKKSAMQK